MMRMNYAEYLREAVGVDEKIQKITLNVGLGCPTRDGKLNRGGCTYCNNKSFNPSFSSSNKSVTEQLNEGIHFFRKKYKKMVFLAYFQAYTNTYGRLEYLIKLYEEALSHPEVVGLIIGTRPDCMPQKLLDYLSDLSTKTFIMIEYGVESTLNRTLDIVHRGHTFEQSIDAIQRTAQSHIPVGAHLIIGLPGETKNEMLEHADKLSCLPLSTIKLHQLQIIKNTLMAEEYRQQPDKFHFMNEDEYIDFCVEFTKRLRPDIVIERYVSQSPKDMVIAPSWGMKNYEFMHKLGAKLGLLS